MPRLPQNQSEVRCSLREEPGNQRPATVTVTVNSLPLRLAPKHVPAEGRGCQCPWSTDLAVPPPPLSVSLCLSPPLPSTERASLCMAQLHDELSEIFSATFKTPTCLPLASSQMTSSRPYDLFKAV